MKTKAKFKKGDLISTKIVDNDIAIFLNYHNSEKLKYDNNLIKVLHNGKITIWASKYVEVLNRI